MLVSDVGVTPSNIPGLRTPGSQYGIFGLGQTASAPAHLPGAHMAYGSQDLFGLGEEGPADGLLKAQEIGVIGAIGGGALLLASEKTAPWGALLATLGLGTVAVSRLIKLLK